MAYTALEALRKSNAARFGFDIGPFQPPFPETEDPSSLKAAALRFLRERCEGLLFSDDMDRKETSDAHLLGKSLKQGQVPYAMQMDIERLNLETSLSAYLDDRTSGKASLVAYCFGKMFLFRDEHTADLVDFLSVFSNAAFEFYGFKTVIDLFSFGLAIAESNSQFRSCFETYLKTRQGDALHLAESTAPSYSSGSADESASRTHRQIAAPDHLLLEAWGLTSLFSAYAHLLPDDTLDESDPVSSWSGAFSEEEQEHFRLLYGQRFPSLWALLAHALSLSSSDSASKEATILALLNDMFLRPSFEGSEIYQAKHSTLRMYTLLCHSRGLKEISFHHVDSMCAILLQYQSIRNDLAYYHLLSFPLTMSSAPLAWLLLLSGALLIQIPYMGITLANTGELVGTCFRFPNGTVQAKYLYSLEKSLSSFRNKPTSDPSYIETVRKFLKKDVQLFTGNRQNELRSTVSLAECPLNVTLTESQSVHAEEKHALPSECSFKNLYQFALALHGRTFSLDTTTEALEQAFNSQSLEYQVSTLSRALCFGIYLYAISCFYSEHEETCERVTGFTAEEAAVFGPLEHERWIRDHLAMGWRYGTAYETVPLGQIFATDQEEASARRALREQLRMHKLAMDPPVSRESIQAHYLELSEEEQDKDWKPFNVMLELLKRFNGISIYRLNTESN